MDSSLESQVELTETKVPTLRPMTNAPMEGGYWGTADDIPKSHRNQTTNAQIEADNDDSQMITSENPKGNQSAESKRERKRRYRARVRERKQLAKETVTDSEIVNKKLTTAKVSNPLEKGVDKGWLLPQNGFFAKTVEPFEALAEIESGIKIEASTICSKSAPMEDVMTNEPTVAVVGSLNIGTLDFSSLNNYRRRKPHRARRKRKNPNEMDVDRSEGGDSKKPKSVPRDIFSIGPPLALSTKPCNLAEASVSLESFDLTMASSQDSTWSGMSDALSQIEMHDPVISQTSSNS